MLTPDKLEQIIKKGVHSISTSSNPCVKCGDKAPHFHGSDLGKCRMKLFYNRHQELDKPISQDLAALFLDGHLHERLIVEAIRNEGIEILQGAEFVRTVDVSLDLFSQYLMATVRDTNIRTELCKRAEEVNHITIIGHTDGIMLIDGKRYLLEVKAVKSYNFKNKFSKGIMPDDYYGQIQCYLNCNNLDKGFLVAKNREDGTICKPIEVKRDERYFIHKCCELLMVQLNQGYLDPYTRALDKPFRDDSNYECRYCDHHQKCWG